MSQPIWEGRKVVVNVGTALQPTSKTQYSTPGYPLPPQLYSHADQQAQWQYGRPQQNGVTGWGGLVAVAVGCLSFLGHWLAPWALVPIVLGAAVLWLPPMRRFSTAWSEHRHPAVEYPPLPDAVAYGPLPRYR